MEAGELGEGCTLQAIPIIADVEVICEVGILGQGSSAEAPPVEFVPQGTGEFTICMSPGSPSATDPDLDNNRLEETVTVEGQLPADLAITASGESADPIAVGQGVFQGQEELVPAFLDVELRSAGGHIQRACIAA